MNPCLEYMEPTKKCKLGWVSSECWSSPSVRCRPSPIRRAHELRALPTLGNNDGRCHTAELLCVKSFSLNGHTTFFSLCLALGSEPSMAPHEWPEKCWLTWLEPRGLNLGVTAFLKIYRSTWTLERAAGCLRIAGFQPCLQNCACSKIARQRVWLTGAAAVGRKSAGVTPPPFCLLIRLANSLHLYWSEKKQKLSKTFMKLKNRNESHTHAARTHTHCAPGALGRHDARGAHVIVDANVCIITGLILVPSGISSHFCASILTEAQAHSHSQKMQIASLKD